MGWIGGDLAAMGDLAQRFRTTSAECEAHATSVVSRVEGALDTFCREMAALETEARALSEEIGTEVTTLRTQAEATVWTGANRTRQDEILTGFESDITGVRTSIDGFVGESSAIVNGPMTTTLVEMQAHTRSAGTTASAAAESFAANVASQRDAFELVFNGGPR